MKTLELNIQKKDLKKALKENNTEKLNQIINSTHYADVGAFILDWDDKYIVTLFDSIDPEVAGKILYSFERPMVNKVIKELPETLIKKIFDKLDIDEAVSLVNDANYLNKKKIVSNISAIKKDEITKQAKYYTYMVGFHMHHEFIVIKDTWTIAQAKKYIKTQITTKDGEITGDILVTTSKKELRGIVTIEDLFVKSDAISVADVIKETPSIKPNEKIELASDLIKKYDVSSVPVINDKKILVGVLEAADIIDYIEDQEEALALLLRPKSVMGKSKTKVFEKPYLEISSKELYKARMGWMYILLIVGTFTQIAITGFQLLWGSLGLTGDVGSGVLGALTWGFVISIAFSTSLSLVGSISGAGGNSGAQTSTTIIRAFALGQIKDKDMSKVYKKEMKTAFMVASTVALFSFLRTYFVWTIYTLVFRINGMQQLFLFLIALVASFSFFIVLLVGNLASIFIPVWAYRKNKDAAVISSPVQSTIVDLFSVVFYLGITSAIFIPLGLWIGSLDLASVQFLI